MLKLLKDKRGVSFIRTCVCVIVLCVVFVVMLNYTMTIVVARSQRKGAIQTLDRYTQANAILIHNSIKDQHDLTTELPADLFVSQLCLAQGLKQDGNTYVLQAASGRQVYKVSNITLGFREELTTKIYASYTLTVSMDFMGRIVWIDVPITIFSELDAKFDVP